MIAPLEITGMSVSHGKKPVFEELSLTLAPQEIFGLIGVNGAGKTSLMKAALSLLEPDAGEARFFGVSSRMPESRQRIAYLPENFRPPPAMSGAQFLRLVAGLHYQRLDREQANNLARALDFDPAAIDRRIGALSKGMAQKLGLVAAFLTGRPLIILDEPMSGLDPRARIMLKTHLLAWRAKGNAIFLSSHILTDLEELCGRIAVLHNGAVRFTGSPRELCARQQEATLERAFLSITA